MGVGAILALIGIVITAILLVKKVKGGILYGIIITLSLIHISYPAQYHARG